MEANHRAAIRSARHLLSAKVREDWDFQWAGPACECSERGDEQNVSCLGWQERYFSSTSESELEAGPSNVSLVEAEAIHASDRLSHELLRLPIAAAEAYKYELADSMRRGDSSQRISRKRKRQRADENEMRWNEGLRYWTRRRDVWTGARYVLPANRSGAYLKESLNGETRGAEGHAQPPAKLVEGPVVSLQSEEREKVDPSTFVPTYDKALVTSSSDYDLTPIAVLPIPEPILPPTHPIRSAIGPPSYLEIYAKVVLSARSPSVPINLVDMTRAVVRGWQDAGEWPPKPSGSAVEPLAGRRRQQAKTEEQDESMADRNGSKDRGVIMKESIQPQDGNQSQGSVKHPHLKKGVESVKRVLRFNTSSQSITPSGPGDVS